MAPYTFQLPCPTQVDCLRVSVSGDAQLIPERNLHDVVNEGSCKTSATATLGLMRHFRHGILLSQPEASKNNIVVEARAALESAIPREWRPIGVPPAGFTGISLLSRSLPSHIEYFGTMGVQGLLSPNLNIT